MEFTFQGGEMGNEQNINKISCVIREERLWRRAGAAVLNGKWDGSGGVH